MAGSVVVVVVVVVELVEEVACVELVLPEVVVLSEYVVVVVDPPPFVGGTYGERDVVTTISYTGRLTSELTSRGGLTMTLTVLGRRLIAPLSSLTRNRT